jgi:hypothetical protein
MTDIFSPVSSYAADISAGRQQEPAVPPDPRAGQTVREAEKRVDMDGRVERNIQLCMHTLELLSTSASYSAFFQNENRIYFTVYKWPLLGV